MSNEILFRMVKFILGCDREHGSLPDLTKIKKASCACNITMRKDAFVHS